MRVFSFKLFMLSKLKRQIVFHISPQTFFKVFYDKQNTKKIIKNMSETDASDPGPGSGVQASFCGFYYTLDVNSRAMSCKSALNSIERLNMWAAKKKKNMWPVCELCSFQFWRPQL